LAQRNPQLKAQIANSHKQFRSRLTSAHARGRPQVGPPTTARTMRRILEAEPAATTTTATSTAPSSDTNRTRFAPLPTTNWILRLVLRIPPSTPSGNPYL
jgi:hypothetical protein